MKNNNFFLSSFYAVNQIGLGLLLHPYQTLQSVVQEKVFVWMTLFPTWVLAVVTILWKVAVVPTVRIFFSCSESPIAICRSLSFFSNWITFFCIYWQILLLYLFFRFSRIYRLSGKNS